MIGDVMGALKLDFRRDEILHDVVDDTVYHYRRWRVFCTAVTWIPVETRLSDPDATNCMACIAGRK